MRRTTFRPAPLWSGLYLLALSSAVTAADLTELLMSKIGVTQPQAVGGAGSIFKLAQTQMTADNFGKIAAVVPGMDKYLGAAQTLLPQLGAVSGGMPATGAVAGAAQAAATQSADTALSNAHSAALGVVAKPAMPTAAASVPAVAAVPATSSATELLAGKAAQWLDPTGGLQHKLQSAEALAPAFNKLGMKSTMVSKFLPVVTDYLKSTGGKSTSKLLMRALGL